MTRLSIHDVDEREAASEASDWGDIDTTGILRCDAGASAFEARKLRTSVWDWRVMSTDSAEVMHPLNKIIHSIR